MERGSSLVDCVRALGQSRHQVVGDCSKAHLARNSDTPEIANTIVRTATPRAGSRGHRQMAIAENSTGALSTNTAAVV